MEMHVFMGSRVRAISARLVIPRLLRKQEEGSSTRPNHPLELKAVLRYSFLPFIPNSFLFCTALSVRNLQTIANRLPLFTSHLLLATCHVATMTTPQETGA